MLHPRSGEAWRALPFAHLQKVRYQGEKRRAGGDGGLAVGIAIGAALLLGERPDLAQSIGGATIVVGMSIVGRDRNPATDVVGSN